VAVLGLLRGGLLATDKTGKTGTLTAGSAEVAQLSGNTAAAAEPDMSSARRPTAQGVAVERPRH
jgi:hypothetical protein